MIEFVCLLAMLKSFLSILVFAFGSIFRECSVEGQTKVDKACLALPQFLVRIGEERCGILVVSQGEYLK